MRGCSRTDVTRLNLKIYNTLTAGKETFEPLTPGAVRIYVCGITPYDETHLGHARCYVFFDTVRRTLSQFGFKVTAIQNFTDIDDKIIARAQSLGRAPQEVADQFVQEYFVRMSLLGVLPADQYPRVTQFLPEIIRFIENLVQKGLAYVSAGDVFYAVEKFKGYGKLSKRDLKDMEAGARVDVNENKQNPLDFALWKSAKPGEPFWDSPWGKGRPGWHIECSVMAMHHLGESFDIHGGGQDLIFPHHENEIAQSEGLTGKPFAKYWLHNGFVTVNREKMSKSLGNFFTLREIFEKVPPAVVRLFLLSRHYRTPLDFSDDLLDQAKSSYRTLTDVIETSFFLLGEEGTQEPILEEWKEKFLESLSDDFNTEKALAVLFGLRNQMVEKIAERDLFWLKRARATLRALCEEFLGIPLRHRLTSEKVQFLKGKLEARQEARRMKDWGLADRIRQEIAQDGYSVEDTPAGPLLKSKGELSF